MVSLGQNFNMNTGAQYMDENTVRDASVVGEVGSNDHQELLDLVLTSRSDNSFKKLKTIPAFSIHLLISTLISIFGIISAVAWADDKRCEAYFIMLILRFVFWVITFLFDHIIKKHHNDLRINGYHDFHRATAMQKDVPLCIVSLWNSVLLAVQAMIHHYYGDAFWEHCVQGFLSPITYVVAFNVVENIVLAAVHGCYIAKVYKFNKASNPPDALRGANSATGSLGLMQPSGSTPELLEKQADLIAYLKEQHVRLSEKLLQLQMNGRRLNMP